MPIYEYGCVSCGHGFEELVRSMSNGGEARCPACGSEHTERRLSVFAPRQGAGASADVGGGPCGRCGDPSGPCALDG